MTFGYLLKQARQARGLSLLDLSHRSGLGGVYLHWLETGKRNPVVNDKTDMVDVLMRALTLDTRSRFVFRFLAGREVDERLVHLVLVERDIALEDFATVAGTVWQDEQRPTRKVWRERLSEARRGREGAEPE